VSTPSLEALKSVALETAIAAGDLLSKGAQMKVNDSTDDDVKMQADVDSEHLVRALLKAPTTTYAANPPLASPLA